MNKNILLIKRIYSFLFPKVFMAITLKFLFLIPNLAHSQTLEYLTKGTSGMRGLSVVSDDIIWACGSDGVILRTTNGGETWKQFAIPNQLKAGFRDIHAFDSAHAIVMAIGNPAMIFETTTSGRIWNTVFNINREGMFLDAFDFSPLGEGILIGDPTKINDELRFFIAETLDFGKNWRELGIDSKEPSDYGRKLIENRPFAKVGEACFASSGTNILLKQPADFIFVSGGIESNLFYKNRMIELPILKGKETTGSNSIAYSPKKFLTRQKLMVVGGDFNSDSIKNKNGVLVKGKSFQKVKVLSKINTYRSCVIYLKNKSWITVGPSVIEITKNDGKTWKSISTDGFFVCQKAKDGKYVYFAGGSGRVGRIFLD